jgi:hypothetical protein
MSGGEMSASEGTGEGGTDAIVGLGVEYWELLQVVFLSTRAVEIVRCSTVISTMYLSEVEAEYN